MEVKGEISAEMSLGTCYDRLTVVLNCLALTFFLPWTLKVCARGQYFGFLHSFSKNGLMVSAPATEFFLVPFLVVL